MDAKQQAEYGDRKLAHYNAWLLDPKREFGTIYPGFPEDLEQPKAKKRIAKVTDKVTKKGKVPAKTKAKRTSKGATKLDQAKALFAANSSLSRAEVIELFMTELGMSKAGATTYFYNAQK